jgi:isoquinoline 1-oxidoreductase alpha subunit
MQFKLNGRPVDFDGDPQTPLLWVIRDWAQLTGEPVRSCVLPVEDVANHTVTTIEGLSKDRSHPVQKAWIEKDVPQCGYCQSGMIMAAAALLQKHPEPTDAQIDEAMTNLCRCATYHRIREAIHAAAGV